MTVSAMVLCGLLTGCDVAPTPDNHENSVYSSFAFRSDDQELPPVDITKLVASKTGEMSETIDGESKGPSARFGTYYSQGGTVPDPKVVHGFQTYEVHADDLTPSTDLATVQKGKKDWNLLVVRGQSVFRVVSGHREGRAEILAFGNEAHAGNLYKTLRHWPVGKGHEYRFVNVLPIRADFLQVSKDGAVIGFVPFMGARAILGMDGEFDPSTIVESRAIMRQLIEAWNRLKPAGYSR